MEGGGKRGQGRVWKGGSAGAVLWGGSSAPGQSRSRRCKGLEPCRAVRWEGQDGRTKRGAYSRAKIRQGCSGRIFSGL